MLKTFTNPQLFWQEVSPHLLKEEAKNNLCLGLSNGFRNKPELCLYQSALFDGEQLMGALVCSQYMTAQNLITSPINDIRSAKLLFEDFLKQRIPLTSIIGEFNSAKTYEKLFNEAAMETQTYMKQGIYRCRKVIPPENDDQYTFRLATLKDLSVMSSWIEQFQLTAAPHEPPVNGRELGESKIKNKMLYIIEENEKLLSMAGWTRDIGTSCSINFVFTPPHLRTKGYGSIVTSQLTQYLIKNGKKEINLYTDMSNSTSNKIYQNIGYEFICHSLHIGVKNLNSLYNDNQRSYSYIS